jgi:secondary thiamine-phosphate synthase enzyme
MWSQQVLEVHTRGRGTANITAEVQTAVRESGARIGLCHVFLQHTSASLMLCENADPMVRDDLEAFMARLAPDGDPLYRHTLEGPDDMPAHVRTVLTHSSLVLPIVDGRCGLGTWQGIYLWEHRQAPHRRAVTVTLQGE